MLGLSRRSAKTKTEKTLRTPSGRRIYVIGDIHGRDDLLGALHNQIADDAAAFPVTKNVVVYLGDYVDRGPQSMQVVERLLKEPLAGFEAVHLMGNHEAMMLEFLEGNSTCNWLLNGGAATVTSYGVDPGSRWFGSVELDGIRKRLIAGVPPRHKRFLRGLGLSHTEGDYIFVHAGIRPGRPLKDQEPRDLLWIRGPFLKSRRAAEKCVVHGHTIVPEPDTAPYRIGIDTGAFFTDRLTCLILDGKERRFIHT